MGLLTVIIVGVPVLLGVVTLYAFSVHLARKRKFQKQNIPYVGARLPQLFKFLTGSIDLVQFEQGMYQDARKSSSPVVAMSDIVGQPMLMVSDVELIRSIFIKDFDHFMNRRSLDTEHSNKWLKRMLFQMEGDQWKGLRSKLSPSFTTGRIRKMFEIFQHSSNRVDTYLKEQINYPQCPSGQLDFTQIMAKYATNVIASCCFGLTDSQTFEVAPDKNSTFEAMGKRLTLQFSLVNLFKFLVVFTLPKLADLLGIETLDRESSTYFSKVIQEVMKHRRETGERREDFLQLFMDVQQGSLKADEETNQVMNGAEDGEGKGIGKISTPVTFDDDDIVTNAILFLIGGLDGTQNVLSFTMYNLALNPEVQEKLYEEVTSVLARQGGQMSYEAMSEMTYLEMVVQESMRLFPAVARAERTCTKDYPVPGTNMVIEKGTLLSLPILGIHNDAKYHPQPEKFDPERFNRENKAKRSPYSSIPFGHGPRNCIGMRFALVKVKTLLVQLVRSFRIEPCSKTSIPMKFGNSPSIKPKDGMWLNITVREH